MASCYPCYCYSGICSIYKRLGGDIMAVNTAALVAIELSLARLLEGVWGKKGKVFTKKIIRAMEQGDLDKAEKVVQSIFLEDCTLGVKRAIKLQGTQAFYFGVSRLVTPADSATQKEKLASEWVGKATKQTLLILKESTRGYRRRIREMINSEFNRQKEEEAKIVKAEVLHDFVSSLEDTLVTGGGFPHLAASLHTSRLASMGYLVEATAMGQKTYIINAVNDVRTCPVCLYLDQKVFAVETLWSRMTQAIEATEVNDLKRLAPWPSQTKAGIASLQEMTSQEIVNSGYDSPPFHAYCRCFIDFTETPVEELDQVVSPFELPGTIIRERVAEAAILPVSVFDEDDFDTDR